MKQKKKISYKFLNIILAIAIIYNFLFLAVTTFTKKSYLNLFGIDFLTINNDLVVTREGNLNYLQEGEKIAYYHNGHIKVGELNNVYYDSEINKRLFSTKVDNHFYPDVEEFSNKIIIGRKLFEIKFIGLFVKAIQSRIFSAFSIIFLWWIYYYNRFKFKAEWKRKVKKKYKEAE